MRGGNREIDTGRERGEREGERAERKKFEVAE